VVNELNITTWVSEYTVPPFLTSALDGDEWSASRPARFTPDAHWVGGWVGPRADLDTVEKNILAPWGIEPRQYRRYTDSAIPAPEIIHVRGVSDLPAKQYFSFPPHIGAAAAKRNKYLKSVFIK
jgi:hypothetical protein